MNNFEQLPDLTVPTFTLLPTYRQRGYIRQVFGGFWIFLKNEHGKLKFYRTGWCRENQALCVGQVSIELI